jgi:serine protease Do
MGIGFSIPSQIVQHVIDQIMNNGGVHRVYLGVVLQPIDKDLADALGLDKQEGVLISDIVKNSPASKAGLQQGDIILQYNSKTAKSISKFSNDIAMMDAGQIINLKVLRKNSTLDLQIPLETQSESEQLTLAEMTQKLGIEVENATPEMASRINIPSDTIGVVITKILPGSPAQLAGLKAGFLISGVAVQGNEPKPIKNTAEFDAALKEINDRKHVILIVRHQNYQRYYTIKIN